MYQVLKKKNVLYVEDDKIVLENISSILSNFFKNFHTADNAEEGNKILNNNKIDLIIMDIELPQINGIDFIKTIRKTNQDISIVIISAYTKTDYLLDSIELNLVKYIVKPLTSKKVYELLDILNNLFNSNNDIIINNTRYAKNSFTKREQEFLDIIKTNKFISYEQIDILWFEPPSQNALRLFIKQLRKKLPTNIIKNKSGIGYYLNEKL